jgi:hypothetical protein
MVLSTMATRFSRGEIDTANPETLIVSLLILEESRKAKGIMIRIRGSGGFFTVVNGYGRET